MTVLPFKQDLCFFNVLMQDFSKERNGQVQFKWLPLIFGIIMQQFLCYYRDSDLLP